MDQGCCSRHNILTRNRMKEYIVIAHTEPEIDSLHDDLVRDTTLEPQVNRSIVPTRPVDVANARLGNPVMTHYMLTDTEAEKLQKDPRVLAIHKPPSAATRKPHVVQRPIAYNNIAGNFNRNSTSDRYNVNWGLRRTSIAAAESPPGTTYTYDRDGAGVDVVIMDDGVEVNHPEFLDVTGKSRVQMIDWYKASGVAGTQSIDFYKTSVGGTGDGEHGTHVASIAAGKTYGYAKNSRIYSLKIFGNARLDDSLHFDVLLGWHQRKPVDPVTGIKRPTVVNMSWGYSWYYSNTPYNTNNSILSVNYRGVLHTYGSAQGRNVSYGQVYSMHGFHYPSEDVGCNLCEQAGIIFVRSAGNSSHKIDISNGPDYNNYYTINTGWADDTIPAGQPIYYHRGSSPSSNNCVVVSAGKDINTVANGVRKEQIDSYSERGPRCDTVAPGTNVTAATSKASTFTKLPYVFGTLANYTAFSATKISGTSMAAPQVTGAVALFLQGNPRATPAQVRNWVASIGVKNQIQTTTTTNDWANSYALVGGPNNFLYNPYHNGYTGL